MSGTTLYKALEADGSAIYGTGSWHLPKGKRPGKWMPPIEGGLIVCERGYHLARRDDLIGWLAPRVFEVEHRGEIIESDDKAVVREARLVREMNWNDSVARNFACDCSERVLHIYEKRYPDDSRVRNCIETARKVANGDLPVSELDAARAAARDAARDAERAAARDAAWDAARAAEREWQTNRLFEYLEGERGAS